MQQRNLLRNQIQFKAQILIYRVLSLKNMVLRLILIVRKLIKAVGTSLSKKERNIFKFDTFEDGKAFQFTNYNYFSTEEIYDRERRNAQALQQAFEDYLKSENLSEKNIPSFSQFIDKNKCNLSSFFSGKTV